MAENNNILEKLDGLEARYEEVSTLITDPSVIADQQRYVKLTKEYKDLEDIMKLRQKYINCLNGIAEAKDIIMNEQDAEMKEMAREPPPPARSSCLQNRSDTGSPDSPGLFHPCRNGGCGFAPPSG